jgi:1,2-diacylglycerol 3-beta-galactosyltransferase
MDELMQAADVVVTKAGPSTICEAIASELPIILSGCVPGQEEGNVRYVCDARMGLLAETPEQVVALVQGCFAPDSPLLEQMRTTMAGQHRPFAARSIAACILSHLPREAGAAPAIVGSSAGSVSCS